MNKWYFTRDGQQSGPVSEVELKGLVASGRLPESSLAWADGMPDWQPISSIPALSPSTAVPSATMADVTASASPQVPAPSPAPAAQAADAPMNPYSAPVSDMNQPVAQSAMGDMEEIIPGSQPLDIGAIISRAFELTKRHFGEIFLVGLTYLGVVIGAQFVVGIIQAVVGIAVNGSINGQSSDISEPTSMGVLAVSLIMNIVLQVLSIFLGLGLTRIGLNIVSGQHFRVGMLFGEANKLVRACIAGLLYGLMVLVGLIFLIVPGIWLALRFGQYQSAIVDKDMGVMDAFSYSSAITTNNRLSLFGLGILGFLIIIAGLIALFVGLIFAYPLVWLAGMLAYRWMQFGPGVVQDRPA